MKKTASKKFAHALIIDRELLGKIEDAKKKFLPYSHEGLSRNAFIVKLITLGLEKLRRNKK